MVRAAVVSEWGPACRLLFGHLPPEDRTLRESTALDMLQRGELNPEGFFVLPGPAGLRGSLLCLVIPGAAGLFWLPGVSPSETDTSIADTLVRHAVAWLRQQGVKLIQCLLIAEEEPRAEPLLRGGFQRVTDLWYLRHQYATPVRCLDAAARLEFVSFAETPRSLFEETLQRTYEGTQDCPEINGVRTVAEVLAGHQAQGRFDPQRWWLALDGKEPVGILLMTELPECGDWDVSYMGVVGSARRRGFGREILLKALTEAWAAGVRRVVLCVDSRNQPAAELYRAMGFEPYDRRAVYLALTPSPGPRSAWALSRFIPVPGPASQKGVLSGPAQGLTESFLLLQSRGNFVGPALLAEHPVHQLLRPGPLRLQLLASPQPLRQRHGVP